MADAREAAGGDGWNSVSAIRTAYSSTKGSARSTRIELEDVGTGRYVVREMAEGTRRAAGFDGITSWVLDRTGVSYAEGDEDARTNAANESYRVQRAWWFDDRHAAAMEDAGVRTEGLRSFDRVTITPLGGRPFTVWVDRNSRLIDRVVEQGAERVTTTRYANYRKVGGLMLPFTLVEDDELLAVSDVQIDHTFAQTEFSLPKAEPLQAGHSVTVPIRFQRGDVIIPVKINGEGPFDCEFDSGGGLVIPPALVTRLGLRRQGEERAFGGGEGSISSGRGTVEALSIGGLEIRNREFATFDLDREHPERFLAGEEVLQRYVIRLDFDSMTMTLSDFADFHYTGGGHAIPFRFQDNDPEVLGSIDGIAATMAIDTGDNGSLLLIAPFAHKYDFATRYHARLRYAGKALTSTRGLYARGGTVAFYGVDGRPVVGVDAPVARISQQESGFDANRYTSANIGMGILRQFNITFDYHRKTIYLEPNHLYGRPDVFDRSGLVLKREADHWSVADVFEGSPAAEKGIKKGDSLAAIDGRTVAELDTDATRALTHGEVGSDLRIRLTTPRGTREVKLKLRDLL